MAPGGTTRRRYVMSEVTILFEPWPFEHLTSERTREIAKTQRLQNSKLDPWFLDNGPLAPSGFGAELPTIIAADDRIDPVGGATCRAIMGTVTGHSHRVPRRPTPSHVRGEVTRSRGNACSDRTHGYLFHAGGSRHGNRNDFGSNTFAPGSCRSSYARISRHRAGTESYAVVRGCIHRRAVDRGRSPSQLTP